MTDTPKFTPGTWEVALETGCRGVVASVSGTPKFVAVMFNDPDTPENEPMRFANAHLIAAAPDLYEALEMVRDADDDCHKDGLQTIPSVARSKIDAAIAKAKGDSQ